LDIEWDTFAYVRSEIGGRASATAKAYLGDKEVKRRRTEDSVLLAAKNLREAMYKPGRGTWFSMTLSITPAGDGWEASFNYTEKPVWELGEPSADAYAQELYLFPRDEEHIPDWFREEVKKATWTPEDA
jgi:hypothetical protein